MAKYIRIQTQNNNDDVYIFEIDLVHAILIIVEQQSTKLIDDLWRLL